MAITKIGTPELFDFSATNTALQLPTGDTASRPSAPSAGEWRYNSELKYVEYYDGAAWFQIDTEAPAKPDDFPSQNFNVNTYTGNGATQKIDAKFNEAANFNGTSSKINITDGGIGNNATARVTFSVSLWINTTSTSASAIISDYDGLAYSFYLQMNTTGTLSIGNYMDGVGSFTTGSATINDGSWHNLILINNTSDNTQKLFIDGNSTPDINHTLTSGTKNAYPIQIGYYATDGLYLKGKIDQVRFFNTALPATGTASVATLYAETTTTAATLDFPAGAGCVAAYQLDGNGNDVGLTTTTTTATYQLDNATTSIPNNTYPGTASSVTYATGKFGDAASFNGSSSKIVVASDFGLTASNSSFTWSSWIKFSSVYTSGFRGLVGSQTTARGGFAINMYGTGSGITTSLERYYSGTQNYSSAYNTTAGLFSYSANVWYNLVIIYDGSTSNASVYVNGTQAGSTYNLNVPVTQASQNETTIGLYGASGYGWQGEIDQVRIFNTALPQAAVTALYNETTTTATSPSISYSTYPGTTTDIGYTGLKFQPDFVWIKQRSSPTKDHMLFDTVRGPSTDLNILYSNLTNDEDNGSSTFLQSISTNALNLGSSNYVNGSGLDYVAWNFKAGGAPTATNSAGAGNVPTSGSVMIDGVASTTALTGTAAVKKISANTAAGFSIVTFSNNASTANTFDHKLGGQPELVFIKGTDVSNDWFTYVDSLGKDKRLKLNSSDNVSNWISNDGTNTPTGINDTTLSFAYSATTYNFIAYLFRSIDKYQKIGSYTGTALSNNFVQTDFTPSFVLIKSSSLTSTYWVIIDSKRSSGTLWLYANTSDDEEGPYTNAALNSNGFTVDGNASYVNGSGETYIYLAIAQ